MFSWRRSTRLARHCSIPRIWGGSGFEDATGIALDADENVYVAGFATSTNFPLVNPLPVASPGAFVTKLSSTGSALM
jgi:hypothetical protein